MPHAGFEPAIPASERPQTHALQIYTTANQLTIRHSVFLVFFTNIICIFSYLKLLVHVLISVKLVIITIFVIFSLCAVNTVNCNLQEIIKNKKPHAVEPLATAIGASKSDLFKNVAMRLIRTLDTKT
jgi:hypothetical protein